MCVLDVQYRNTPIGRRALLRGAAMSSMLVLVVACGGDTTSLSDGADGAGAGAGAGAPALDGEVVEVWRDPG